MEFNTDSFLTFFVPLISKVILSPFLLLGLTVKFLLRLSIAFVLEILFIMNWFSFSNNLSNGLKIKKSEYNNLLFFILYIESIVIKL